MLFGKLKWFFCGMTVKIPFLEPFFTVWIFIMFKHFLNFLNWIWTIALSEREREWEGTGKGLMWKVLSSKQLCIHTGTKTIFGEKELFECRALEDSGSKEAALTAPSCGSQTKLCSLNVGYFVDKHSGKLIFYISIEITALTCNVMVMTIKIWAIFRMRFWLLTTWGHALLKFWWI